MDAPPSPFPRWHDPAGAAIWFHHDKAFGLGFDPRRLEDPILFGGDYHGNGPVAAALFLRTFRVEEELESYGMAWFLPFAHRLAEGIDFSMEELLAAARASGCVPWSR